MPRITLFALGDFTFDGDRAQLETTTVGDQFVGSTLAYGGSGQGTSLRIADEDRIFEDAYVESGSSQTLKAPVTINGTTFPAGSVVENEFALLDAAGNVIFMVRIAEVNVGFAYPSGTVPASGAPFTIASARDGKAADSLDGIESDTPYQNIHRAICFAAGTRITTPRGPVAVETLAVGDLVMTLDHGPRPVRWIGRTLKTWRKDPDPDKPIAINAGALGPDLPHRDLMVSPQHRLLLRTGDGSEVLTPAKALCDQSGVRQKIGCRKVTYVHVMLSRHAVLEAEGVLSESFFPGPYALMALSPADRRLVEQIAGARYDGARHFLGASRARSAIASGALRVATRQAHLAQARA